MHLTALLLSGCTISLPAPITAGEGFFDRPWPSNTRTIDGHPDLSDFPNLGEYDLLTGFIALGESLDGFGTNTPIYFRFDGALPTDLLPSPAQSRREDSAVLLVNIDRSSPRRGEIIPVEWAFQKGETNWQPDNLLAVRPVWGFPLEGQTTYAAVVTTQVAQPADGFSEVWAIDHAQHAEYEPLQETLFQLKVPLESVAVATVFTTQDTLGDMVAISASIQQQLPIPVLDQELADWYSTGTFSAYTGEIVVPMWQHGEKPYATEGGGFVFDEEGEPVLYGWDRTAFAVTIPNGSPPADGWPTVIYSHGTGGDHTTFASGSTNVPATILAEVGIAVIGISQPLHGDRGSGVNPALYSFNYINPEAGRTMFRQGALDQVFMAELMTNRQAVFSFEGQEIRLDPDRVAYLGHSHGGEVGAKAVPFFGDRIKAAVLSGTGGGLGITLIERNADDFDIQSLITDTLEFDSDEVLDTFHPTVMLIQMDAESTDPINYAPYWHQRQLTADASPVSVLQTEGLLDENTPPHSTEVLAGAAGTPMLAPTAQTATVQELTGLIDEPTPAISNVTAWDGSAVSVGLAQFPDEGHFAIFREYEAVQLYQTFLSSSLEEEVPEITTFEP
ncbi:MAG: pimeloyl-ACP methyl ester carboxylesterase [Myxococcota bacterium]|jgi:pimeloyl-ACP methyl ester carboxylesterase